jgi:sarcosine oxidase subunit gamma
VRAIVIDAAEHRPGAPSTSRPALRSPLADFDLAGQAVPMDARCAVWANELPAAGVISLRGNAGDPAFMAVVRHSLGIEVPTAPSTVAATGLQEMLWLAPDEWLIVCPHANAALLTNELTTAMRGLHHQAVDNSGGFTQIELCGSKARTVLAHCSVYDFSKLVPGRVVGTTFGSVSATIRHGRRISAEHFIILARRSFADYVWRYLVRAASPYGFAVHSIEA